MSLKVVDINNEDERNQYERGHSRIRFPSSSPVQYQAIEKNLKPTSLYVSNWTDDEKTRRTKVPMRLNDAQIADR